MLVNQAAANFPKITPKAMPCATVKIVDTEHTLGYVIINESEFDGNVHTKYVDDTPVVLPSTHTAHLTEAELNTKTAEAKAPRKRAEA